MTMRRILVTGASTPLGRRLVARLGGHDDVEAVGVDAHRGVPTTLLDTADTVIHAAMCPARSGTASRDAADVIATQQLAAIIGRVSPVRVVVGVSSTEVYPPGSAAPQWRSEGEALRPAAGSRAALILEAESYLRDVAQRQPHISVSILRLADLVGAGISSPLTSSWTRQVVPFVPGYDPAIQLLHVDDAVGAIEHAADRELAGTMNVAGEGVVTWRGTARLSGRLVMPAAIVPDGLAAMLTTLRVPHVPASDLDLLRFGRCVDTAALRTSGFRPEHSTESCARELRSGRSVSRR